MDLVELRVGHAEVFKLPAGFDEVFRRIYDIIDPTAKERNKARIRKRDMIVLCYTPSDELSC
jgi:hypothetical protein